MAKLSTAARKDLPKKDFAGPRDSYPVPDRKHAKAAILDAGIEAKRGKISSTEKSKIDRKADAVLKKTDKSKQK